MYSSMPDLVAFSSSIASTGQKTYGNIYHRSPAGDFEKGLRFYVINAHKIASDTGMGGRINTVMQTCFFAISGILPKEEAIAQIKQSIKKTYGKRGEAVVQRNFQAVDETLAHLNEVNVPARARSKRLQPFLSSVHPLLCPC